jgi:hypothetical protein
MLTVLLILALLAIILVYNTIDRTGRRIDVNLVVANVTAIKSLVFLSFTGVGVLIGVLLK